MKVSIQVLARLLHMGKMTGEIAVQREKKVCRGLQREMNNVSFKEEDAEGKTWCADCNWTMFYCNFMPLGSGCQFLSSIERTIEIWRDYQYPSSRISLRESLSLSLLFAPSSVSLPVNQVEHLPLNLRLHHCNHPQTMNPHHLQPHSLLSLPPLLHSSLPSVFSHRVPLKRLHPFPLL